MENEPKTKSAVIYCRAASVALSREDAVVSQERRGREKAAERGYDVVGMFCDIAPGTDPDRPAMNELLTFLRDRADSSTVVLVDHNGAFACSVATHHELRRRLRDVGGELETTMARFGDSRDSMLAETLAAALAEHWGDPFVESGVPSVFLTAYTSRKGSGSQ